MKFKVLVVDDNLNAAKDYAQLIHIKTKLEAIGVEDPSEALQIIESNSIHVVVLDQRMPKMDGTDLYHKIISIDPHIKVLMLTGEATSEEVGYALHIGYKDFITKEAIAELPNRVLNLYTGYQLELAMRLEAYQSTPIYKLRRRKLNGHQIIVSVLSMEVLDENFIFPDSWRWLSNFQVKSGQPLKEIKSNTKIKKFIHEKESESRFSAKLDLGSKEIIDFNSQFESYILDKHKDLSSFEETSSNVVEKEYRLADEPANPNELHVRSRLYERAPIYAKLRCVLLKSCNCCGNLEPISILVYLRTNRIKTRHTDFLSDGTSRIIPTGDETVS